MLRSTKKEVKNAIQEFICREFFDCEANDKANILQGLKELQYEFKGFESKYLVREYPIFQERFMYFCECSHAYTYKEERELLQQWLQMTDTELNKKDKGFETTNIYFYSLVYRELKNIFKKYDFNFYMQGLNYKGELYNCLIC